MLASGGAVSAQVGAIHRPQRCDDRTLRHLSSLAMNFTSFIQQLVSVGVVIVGLYMFDAGDVTPGAIIAAVILASRAVAPLGQIAGTLSRAQQAIHSYPGPG